MTATLATITILLADDDPDDRLMARDAFRECGVPHELRCVRDGEELLDYLQRRGEYAGATHALPGLVLLDLNMPRKDGREALREIRADAVLRALPVVMLSTSGAEEDIARAYAEGVNSFITKPASFEGMVAMVRALAQYWLQVVDLPRPPAGR